ncbi:MAG: ECF transporter S component [bacterium]
MSPRSVATVAVLAALVAALGFLLSGILHIPNVELVSLASFASGTLLGPSRGAAASGLGMAIYSGLNPYGAAPPPTYLSQVAGMALFGAAGGVAGPPIASPSFAKWRGALAAGGLGLVLTFLYDGLTNLGTAISIGAARHPWPILVAGWAFGAWHVASNVVFFAGLAPPLLAALRRRRAAAL